MASQLYVITAKTHLHAGSGNTNAGVIDNLVQRDPSDNLPCIYASSLKGAFREYFEEYLKDVPKADKIFGAGINKRKENDTNAKGTHIFHQASLLSIPVRSNLIPFFNATSPAVLQKFLQDAKLFGLEENVATIEKECIDAIGSLNKGNDPIVYYSSLVTNLKIEDCKKFTQKDKDQIPQLKKIFGDHLVVFPDKDFQYLCGDLNLPVIARNNLENGQSKNLWYEQIVPREARFYFFTVHFESDDKFAANVNAKEVQIGANASIGYGLCKINNLQTQIQ